MIKLFKGQGKKQKFLGEVDFFFSDKNKKKTENLFVVVFQNDISPEIIKIKP